MREWRVMVAETVTGNIVADVRPRDMPSFSRALTDKGTWTVNVIPDDRHNQHVDMHALTDAGRYTWIIAADDYVVQAGPTWTHSFDENTRNVSVSGTGIQGIFERRVLRKTDAVETSVFADLVYTSLSLRGIARAIVNTNLTTATYQVGYGLPIDLPASEAGSNKRTYQAYDLAMVWERLVELSQVINGPELDFRPFITTDQLHVRWEMLIGTPLLGDQDSDAVWDYGGALSAIDVDNNGSAAPCTRAWVRGAGSERETILGYAYNTDPIALGYPPVDYVDNDHTSTKTRATLNDHAEADLQEFIAPTETWQCSVRVDGTNSRDVQVAPALGTWAIGDQPTFSVVGHPWIADGQYRRRILGYSNDGDDPLTVKLELKPEPEVI